MQGFAGFPDGKLEFTPIPDLFFSDLLPLIDHLAELQVTLACLWLIQQKKGAVRYVTLAELAGDERLMCALRQDADALREGLERAVARGTLLQVQARRPGQAQQEWFFLNSEGGRAALAQIEQGEWPAEESFEPARLSARRPTIFNLYEQNIGLLQPMLAQELLEAERIFPPDWIEDAFRIAAGQNVRRWAYIRGILERWARDGRDDRTTGRPPESKQDRRRYVEGPYADAIDH